MKTYKIELNLEEEIVDKRLGLSKEFIDKLQNGLYKICKDETISCTDSIKELENICSNDNEFACLSMQIGRIYENPEIREDIINLVESKLPN